MEGNFFVRLWNRLIYYLNVALGEEPSDMLLQQQTASYQRGIDQTYSQIKHAGGRLSETLTVLATNKSKLSAAETALDRSVKERKKMAEGSQEALFKDQEIATRAKMVAGLQKLVASMETMINQSRRNQGQAELNFKRLSMQRDLANVEAGMYVDQEEFAKIQEEIANAQLAAAGITKSAGAIRDHRGQLKRRAARAEGRADVATRMASDMTGFQGDPVALDADEQAVLDEALRRAGVSPASESKSASAG